MTTDHVVTNFGTSYNGHIEHDRLEIRNIGSKIGIDALLAACRATTSQNGTKIVKGASFVIMYLCLMPMKMGYTGHGVCMM